MCTFFWGNISYLFHNLKKVNQEAWIRDFPGGPVVRNLPANAGNTGLIPDQELKFHMCGQLSLCVPTTELARPKAHALQEEKPPHREVHCGGWGLKCSNNEWAWMHYTLSRTSCLVLQALHPSNPSPSHKASSALTKKIWTNFGLLFYGWGTFPSWPLHCLEILE